MAKIERRIDYNRAAWIDDGNGNYDLHLFTTHDGHQSSSCRIADLDTAKAAYHVLGEWIKREDKKDVDKAWVDEGEQIINDIKAEAIHEACDWFDKQSSARTITSMLRGYADELVKEG